MFLARLDHRDMGEDPIGAWNVTHTCASAAEKVYMGMERVMLLLVAGVDRMPLEKSPAWHSELIARLGEASPSRRPPILSPPLCAAVNRLRAFRHRERDGYAGDLNLLTVIERAEEALTPLARFRDEVRAFPAAHAA